MDGNDSDIKAWLSNHPRMMGVLFVLLLALTQVGSAAGAAAATTVGP